MQMANESMTETGSHRSKLIVPNENMPENPMNAFRRHTNIEPIEPIIMDKILVSHIRSFSMSDFLNKKILQKAIKIAVFIRVTSMNSERKPSPLYTLINHE